jgi:hypothetical protein
LLGITYNGVRTDMTGHFRLIDPEESVQELLALLEALSLEATSEFWHQNGERLPW